MSLRQTANLAIAESYSSARDRFLGAAVSANWPVQSYVHPSSTGIDGEALGCDVVTVGDPHAPKALIVSSGIHGIEGYCGNAIQCALLEDDRLIGNLGNVRLIIVHALNPHGFSHFRRVNEDNVDVNRNFRDFAAALPADEEYGEIRSLIYPGEWHGAELTPILAALREVGPKVGDRRLQEVLTRGQYEFAGDPFFGGHRETWSRQIWTTICADASSTSESICHVDIHTGLGAYGDCEIIYASDVRADKVALAKTWFGADRVRIPGHDDSMSSNITGFLGAHLSTHCANEVSIAMEFGTVPTLDMMETVIADNWLAANPSADSKRKESIRNSMKYAFFSTKRAWLEQVESHAFQIVKCALEGLG